MSFFFFFFFTLKVLSNTTKRHCRNDIPVHPSNLLVFDVVRKKKKFNVISKHFSKLLERPHFPFGGLQGLSFKGGKK